MTWVISYLKTLPPCAMRPSRHPDLGELLLLLDALLGADGDLAVLRADRLGPRQDVLADDEDLRQRLLHGVLEERPRLEQGVLQDRLDLVPAMRIVGQLLTLDFHKKRLSSSDFRLREYDLHPGVLHMNQSVRLVLFVR